MEVSEVKRVLIFSIAYYPHVGGAEVAVKEITDRMDNYIFDMVTLKLSSADPNLERISTVNIHRLDCPKILFPFFAFLKAACLHRINRYSFTWSIMANYAGFAGLFFKTANPQIPFLLTLQEGDPEEYILKKIGFLYPLWRQIFRKADAIQAISSYLADFGRRHGAKVEIKIVPNGVDLNKFRPTGLRPEKTEKIIITASRLVEKNAVDDVIRAMQYLPENYKFEIFGIGEKEKELKKLAKDLKLENRVEFFGFGKEKMIEHFQRADVFVRPSRSEGLGNSFLEAMASGLSVIGTPVGGIPDFLKDGETGLFCEINNPKSIAEKVLELENSELREKIIANGLNLVSEKYDWNLIADKMKIIFNKL